MCLTPAMECAIFTTLKWEHGGPAPGVSRQYGRCPGATLGLAAGRVLSRQRGAGRDLAGLA